MIKPEYVGCSVFKRSAASLNKQAARSPRSLHSTRRRGSNPSAANSTAGTAAPPSRAAAITFTRMNLFIAFVILFSASCFTGADGQAWKSKWVTSPTRGAVIIPVKAGVTTYGLLNVGEGVPNLTPGAPAGSKYRLVGLPDGMGIYRINNSYFGVVVNHEIDTVNGAVRRHGATGAFVSKWLVNSKTLKVEGGEDLVQEVYLWDTAASAYAKQTYQFARFCSANLAPVSSFYDEATKTGTKDRIFMNGEEAGSNVGKAFAHIVTGAFAGKSYEMARMGTGSYENVIAAPYTGAKTVLIGSDDAGPPYGHLNVLFGTKQPCAAGDNPLKCAGILDGALWYIRIPVMLTERIDGIIVGGDSGLDFELVPNKMDGTAFYRPEDCHWDPVDRNTFYCAMTGAIDAFNRLWKFVFNDATALVGIPAIAGKAYILVEGDPNGPADANPKMMDNLVAYNGGVIMQEDSGGAAHIAQLWRYCHANKKLEVLAKFDPALFTPGAPGFLTQDEESSGIINLDVAVGYAKNCFLLTAQIHIGLPDPELIQDGQLLVMCLPPTDVCPGTTVGQRTCPAT